jgi:preprotein translocase subunit SecF
MGDVDGVMVRGMADEQAEPGEVTERFRAFAETVDPEPSKALHAGLIAMAGAMVLVLIVVVWVLFTS